MLLLPTPPMRPQKAERDDASEPIEILPLARVTRRRNGLAYWGSS